MASLSVDGLISGLDTTSLISQLISAESTAQTRLKTQLSTTQAAATAYRSINTKIDALRTAAEELTKATTWGAAKATSSSPGVTASVTGTPQPGQLSFTVGSLASAQSSMSDTRWDTTATAFGSSSLTITSGGTTTTITVGGTGTLDDAVSAINASAAGVTAIAVRLEDGRYGLLLNARKTGVANGFTVGGAGTFTSLSTAADARVHLGSSTGPAVTSSTNTFGDLLPGATITVSAETDNPVTVSIVADPEAVAAKVKSFVDAANAALTEIRKHSNSATGSTAVLKGDSELRALTNTLLQDISEAVSGAGSPASIGIELTRDGTVKYTEATFLATLQSSPATAQRLLTGSGTPAVEGISQRLIGLADRATDSTTGSLTLLANGRDALAADFKDRIADWDLRLAARRETLTRQFTAMETALSSLKSQSSWLAGQLGSLPSSS